MHSVDYPTFLFAMGRASVTNPRITDACSDAAELPPEAAYYLNATGTAGFGITGSGELIAVFAAHPGHGAGMVDLAVRLGATHLNCFDGPLVEYYDRHGFRVVERQPNWVDGQPDVVWMRHGNS